MKSALQLDAAGATDVGQERDHNEDSIVVDSQSHFYAIADGMGGHMSGEVASQATLDELASLIKNHAQSTQGPSKQDDYYNIVLSSVMACSELILEKNRNNGSNLGEGMGTTLVGAYFMQCKSHMIVFNVGDSRLYRLRAGVLEQLTRDQTMYQDWHDRGQKGTAPSKNILLKAIGLTENNVPDITLEAVFERDIFLICSDGLSNMIDDESLQCFLNENLQSSANTLCKDLISIANINGGHDNISVVAIKVNSSTTLDNPVGDLDKTIQRQSV